ncbi:transcription repressor OFP8-like [Iris pallida]|uniref:Transcription repressor n=1 Tax=Iris pallida TaxID=29817 RepID=A0AAX6E2H7_IRIPA|nr:transcription repressor OFP8-like [Iris pallida]
MSSSSSSSSSSRRRFHVRRHPVVVDIGCSCRKPKLFSGLLHNLSLPVRNNNNNSLTSASNKSSESTCSLTTTTFITNSTFSPFNDDTTGSSSSSSTYASPKKKQQQQQPPAKKKKKKKANLMAEESVAVEKVSSDPYVDFKESMLQMIVEKEIYQWEELRELLNLFLSLNSPYHHHLILRAFAEIWEGIFSPPTYVT